MMGLLTSFVSFLTLGSAASAASLAQRGTSKHLSKNAQNLYDYAMQVGDSRYDSSYNYIWYQDNGQWSVRFTAWFLPGLLHRGTKADVAAATAAIENILSCQLNSNFTAPWYGTFKLAPDEPDPTPNSPLYVPVFDGSWDPNWREFIGTQLIQVIEEFEDKLPKSLVTRMEDALLIAAEGGMRRNGTFPEGDTLILGYSNIQNMRVLNIGWIGERRKNQTLIDFATKSGNDLLSLFERDGQNVLGEYNAPNYYGIDIWALAANIAYGPKSLPMTANARTILCRMWDDIANHYNPYLGNMVGPYDRAYSRDANTHSQILSMVLWGVYGRGVWGQPPTGEADLLYDIAQGAAFALVTDVIASTIGKSAAAAITAKQGPWAGSRTINKTIYEDLSADASPRFASSWISSPLMIGGQTVTETRNRGNQYTPGTVQWAADPSHRPYPYMGWFSLYPSASTIVAEATANRLVVAYPNTTQAGTGVFTFALSGIPPKWTLGGKNVVTGLEDLPCLSVNVSAPGLVKQDVVYGAMLRDHWIYNISYAVPGDFKGTPRVELNMKYTC